MKLAVEVSVNPVGSGKLFQLVGAIFLFAGLVMGSLVGYFYYMEVAFEKIAVKTDGVVTDLVRQRSTNTLSSSSKFRHSSSTFRAVVAFKDSSGRSREYVDSAGSNPPRYEIGDTVQILYDPQRPSRAAIDDTMGRFGLIIIVGGLASIFTLLGGILLALGLRKAA